MLSIIAKFLVIVFFGQLSLWADKQKYPIRILRGFGMSLVAIILSTIITVPALRNWLLGLGLAVIVFELIEYMLFSRKESKLEQLNSVEPADKI